MPNRESLFDGIAGLLLSLLSWRLARKMALRIVDLWASTWLGLFAP